MTTVFRVSDHPLNSTHSFSINSISNIFSPLSLPRTFSHQTLSQIDKCLTTMYEITSDLFCMHSFKKEIEAKGGVKAYRFGPNEQAFADPEHLPENRCYCPSSVNGNSSSSAMPTMSTQSTNSNQCAPQGTFNVSLCQYGE